MNRVNEEKISNRRKQRKVKNREYPTVGTAIVAILIAE